MQYDWLLPTMRLQVIHDSLFSRLGSGPFSGRGERESRNRTIPSSAVKKIRSAFPADNSVYTGYVEGDDDDSAHDSELEQAWRDF